MSLQVVSRPRFFNHAIIVLLALTLGIAVRAVVQWLGSIAVAVEHLLSVYLGYGQLGVAVLIVLGGAGLLTVITDKQAGEGEEVAAPEVARGVSEVPTREVSAPVWNPLELLEDESAELGKRWRLVEIKHGHLSLLANAGFVGTRQCGQTVDIGSVCSTDTPVSEVADSIVSESASDREPTGSDPAVLEEAAASDEEVTSKQRREKEKAAASDEEVASKLRREKEHTRPCAVPELSLLLSLPAATVEPVTCSSTSSSSVEAAPPSAESQQLAQQSETAAKPAEPQQETARGKWRPRTQLWSEVVDEEQQTESSRGKARSAPAPPPSEARPRRHPQEHSIPHPGARPAQRHKKAKGNPNDKDIPMQEILQTLKEVDQQRVLIVRKIKKLGFNSANALKSYGLLDVVRYRMGPEVPEEVVAPHADPGLLVLSLPASAPGLQLRDADGNWQSPPPGCGALWAGAAGRTVGWAKGMHRVLATEDRQPRLSAWHELCTSAQLSPPLLAFLEEQDMELRMGKVRGTGAVLQLLQDAEDHHKPRASKSKRRQEHTQIQVRDTLLSQRRGVPVGKSGVRWHIKFEPIRSDSVGNSRDGFVGIMRKRMEAAEKASVEAPPPGVVEIVKKIPADQAEPSVQPGTPTSKSSTDTDTEEDSSSTSSQG